MFKFAPYLRTSSPPSLTIAYNSWTDLRHYCRMEGENPLCYPVLKMGYGYLRAQTVPRKIAHKRWLSYILHLIRARAIWEREILPCSSTDRKTQFPRGHLSALEDAELVLTSADQALGCQEHKTSLSLSPSETKVGRVEREIYAGSGVNFI